jgi:hypothetical protein
MPETAQQYTERILGYLGNQNPLKVQASTLKAIEKLIQRAPKASLKKRPAPGKWSVGEILAHLADNEIVAAFRIRIILGAPGSPLTAYDQDAWAEAFDYAKVDPAGSFATFRAVREANLSLLKRLKPDQWRSFGIHAERGEESIEKMAKLYAGHDINHLRQIEAILKPKKK